MYAPWDWDLYFLNNCLWDTRPEKLYKIFYTNTIEEYNKKKFRRIYFDIINNMDISTIKYYDGRKWEILIDATKLYKKLMFGKDSDNDNLRNFKNIASCDAVCNIIEKVLKYDCNDLFVDKKAEKYFWRFILELCNYSDFNRWFKVHYFSWCCNDTSFLDTSFLDKSMFEEFIWLLYLNIMNENKNDEKILGLVTLLYYLYNEYVKIKNTDLFLAEFPSETINKIKSIKEYIPYFVGENLVELIKIKKQSMAN